MADDLARARGDKNQPQLQTQRSQAKEEVVVLCEEREKLANEYDGAVATLDRFAASMKEAPLSEQDVPELERMYVAIYEKSTALRRHEKTHGCLGAKPRVICRTNQGT